MMRYIRPYKSRGKSDQATQDHKKSSEALIEAVKAFPSVVPILADKADISLPGPIRAHQSFRIHTDAGYGYSLTDANRY